MTKIDSVRKELRAKELSKILKQVKKHGLSQVLASGYVDTIKVDDLIKQESIEKELDVKTADFMKQKPIKELQADFESKYTKQKNTSRDTITR